MERSVRGCALHQPAKVPIFWLEDPSTRRPRDHKPVKIAERLFNWRGDLPTSARFSRLTKVAPFVDTGQKQNPAMMYVDMENGQVWQELLPSDKRYSPDDPGTPTSVLDAPRSTRGLATTKHLSLNGFPKHTDGMSTPVLKYGQAKVIQGRPRKRVVFKNGTVNLSKEHVSKRSQRYLQDIFTTMVDIQWRWNLLAFAMGFILSWLGFAIIWWLISFAHGDFDHLNENDWKPCIANVKSFSSAFLFSIETQHTIGYGSRFTTEECPEAIFIMCVQSITGVMIQCFMVGIVFAKLSRPKKRSQTLMFSRHAIVSMRDGRLCLMFRVGDMRKSHIIGAHISAQIIRKKVTAEGEIIPYYHSQLDVRFDNGSDNIFLIWPAIIVHEIDENSPLYCMRAEDMVRERYELVVILEGTIESTGQSIQARTSYLPTEILWGHRFEQVVSYRKETGDYLVDYSRFDSTYEVETPLCSARDYYEYQKVLAEASKMTLALRDRSVTGLSLDSLRRSESGMEARSLISQNTQRTDSSRDDNQVQVNVLEPSTA